MDSSLDEMVLSIIDDTLDWLRRRIQGRSRQQPAIRRAECGLTPVRAPPRGTEPVGLRVPLRAELEEDGGGARRRSSG